MPADRITPSTQLILQGMQSAGGVTDAMARQQEAAQKKAELEKEKNRPLHPGIQALLDEVMAGRMTPQEAGIRGKLLLQGGGVGAPSPVAPAQTASSLGNVQAQPGEAPTPPPSAPQPYGMASQFGGMAPGSEGGLSSAAMQQAAQQPQVSRPVIQPQRSLADIGSQSRPYTAQDASDIAQLSPFFRSQGVGGSRGQGGLSDESWQAREEERRKTAIAREEAKRQTNSERYQAQNDRDTARYLWLEKAAKDKADGKKLSDNDEREFKRQMEIEKHKNKMEEIKEKAKEMAERGATEQEWKKLDAKRQTVKAYLDHYTKLMTSDAKLIKDPEVTARIEEVKSQLKVYETEYNEAQAHAQIVQPGQQPRVQQAPSSDWKVVRNPRTGERARFNTKTGEMAPLE